jgi:transcriptional regulator with XRE-family HTH domain
MEREAESEALRLAALTMRLARGWKQKEVAEALGMAPSTISGYELGYRRVSRRTVEAIAGTVGVSLDVLEALLPGLRALCRGGGGRRPRAPLSRAAATDVAIEEILRKAEAAMRTTLELTFQEPEWDFLFEELEEED